MAKKNAVVKWDADLAKYAEADAAAATGSAGNFLSVKGGVLAYKGNPLPDNKIEVIVLDFVQENQYYEDDYDADNPASPICYAFGRKEAGKDLVMAPHEEAPQKQCEDCKSCEHFEWKSAKKGKGKACKEVRRLCLILASAVDDPKGGDVDDAEEVFLKVSVTNTKAWDGYVQQVAALKRPQWAVVTEIKVVADPKNQFRFQFKLVEQVNSAVLFEKLLARHKAARPKLVTAYPVFEEDDAPRAKSKARSNGKAKPKAKPPAARKPTKPAPAAAARTPAKAPAGARQKY